MNPLAPYMIWIKLAGTALVAVAIAGASWWVTSNYYDLKIADMKALHQAGIIIAQDAAAHKQADADKITSGVIAASLEARNGVLQGIIDNLRRTPIYVSPETDARFPLPCGFVRLHNAAVAGGADPSTIPLPAGATDASQCDVKASAAIGIIQDNYALALGWKAERDSWWDWYAQQAANWNKPPEAKGNSHG